MPEPFIKQLRLTDFLSFGPESEPVALGSLNLLIGPNGTGKSNLVEAFSVLQATPSDLGAPIRRGGGIADWLHRGERVAEATTIEVVFGDEHLERSVEGSPTVHYRLTLGTEGASLLVVDERIESEEQLGDGSPPHPYFQHVKGGARMMAHMLGVALTLDSSDLDRTQSIVSQRRDPKIFPEVTSIGDQFGRIAIYRDWSFGPNSIVRQSARIDSRSDRLSESLDNLAVRIAALSRVPAVKKALIAHIADVAPGFSDIVVVPEGGRLQLYLTEGDYNVAAHRLSDGTLRYLVLLAILLDPSPPPLVVIEEPELGLHFDLVAKLAALLRDARTRMQLVVTTHSEALVDAFSDEPEVVLVCEKRGATTHLERLSREDLAEWLKSYSLGEIWRRGEIGGTRW